MLSRAGAHFLLSITVLLGGWSCTEGPENTPFEQARVVRFDSDVSIQIFLAELAEHYQLPAVAAAIVTPDHRIESAVYGKNKTVEGQALLPDSIFHLGSCGKSITALLAATLVEEGALEWSTTVGEVFPELQGLSSVEKRNITLRGLLSHTAGIPPFTSDQEIFSKESDLVRFDQPIVEARRAFALWVLEQDPANETGIFNYSNAGYAVVGAMLEQVKGKPYERLLEDRIFAPLDMTSAIVGFAVSSDPSQPWRHMERDSDSIGIPLALHERGYPEVLNPAGNISMSIEDFGSYVAFHVAGLRGENGLVSSRTLKTLHSPVVRIDAGEQYAMGWYIREIGGTTVSTHFGSDQTIFAVMSIDHSSGRSAAVVTNIGGPTAEMALVNAILEFLH